MKYQEISALVNKNTKTRRLGRGISAGQGKTAGRGTKGQRSRAGSTARPGFSGGQNPLMQQLPKLPGFKSQHIAPVNVKTSQLNKLKKTKVSAQDLFDNGLIANPYLAVKVLFDEAIKQKMEVYLTKASKNAIDSIEAAGGLFKTTERLARPKTSQKTGAKVKKSLEV